MKYGVFLSDDDIRQNEGFKNVLLGNVFQTRMESKQVTFLSPEDRVCVKELLGLIESWWCSGRILASIL
jgi:hypothetical protein